MQNRLGVSNGFFNTLVLKGTEVEGPTQLLPKSCLESSGPDTDVSLVCKELGKSGS